MESTNRKRPTTSRCFCSNGEQTRTKTKGKPPLHFVVYEDEAGKTFVAYDTFVSLLAQYQCEGVTQVAQVSWKRSWSQ